MKKIKGGPKPHKQMDEDLTIIPLCGLEQIGGNSNVIRYKNQIVIVDAGMGFPAKDVYGIDYYIPNFDYLLKNKDLIEGIVITHGHLDHIGAISHFIEKLGFPEVYAPKFAIELIKIRLREKKLLDKAKLVEINRDSKLQAKDITIEYFHVNHSIPDALGVVIKTPAGNIVHTGDFKFDNSPVNEDVADYSKIAKVGSEKVLALLSDSTNSFREGHSVSESNISSMLEEVCEDAKGRIVVATFSSLVTRLFQLIEIAKKLDRKVFISGRSMENTIGIAKKTGYIDAPDNIFIGSKSLNRYSDERVMILATGAQGESMAALSRMARGEHREVNIKRGDSIILSASVIPGNEHPVQKMIDELTKKGANVFHREVLDLHTSGHGHKEDQKLMINLVKPKYFIPVHGYQSFRAEHSRTAQKIGIKEKNIIMANNGDIIKLNNRGWRKQGRVKAYPLYVSGLGVGDIGTRVLAEREQLANFGVVIISLVAGKKNRKLLGRPQITTRGFVYVGTNMQLINRIEERVKRIYYREAKSTQSMQEIRRIINKEIKRLLYKEIEREPMILTLIERV